MAKPGRILLVEDDANDVEMTFSALAENGLANGVFVVRDGEEALDYFIAGGLTGREKKAIHSGQVRYSRRAPGQD